MQIIYLAKGYISYLITIKVKQFIATFIITIFIQAQKRQIYKLYLPFKLSSFLLVTYQISTK